MGGVFVRGEVLSLRDLRASSAELERVLRESDVLVNATGLSSHSLVPDSHLIPIRGYLVRVSAPSIHHFYMHDSDWAYLFPRHGDVVCGGTYEPGQWSTAQNDSSRQEILRKCSRIIPDIEHATILNEWIGVRPHRSWIRCELEMPTSDSHIQHTQQQDNSHLIPCPTMLSHFTPSYHAFAAPDSFPPITPPCRCPVPIIHAYGLGGSGMTLHWGLAADVVAMTRMIQAPNGSAKQWDPSWKLPLQHILHNTARSLGTTTPSSHTHAHGTPTFVDHRHSILAKL